MKLRVKAYIVYNFRLILYINPFINILDPCWCYSEDICGYKQDQAARQVLFNFIISRKIFGLSGKNIYLCTWLNRQYQFGFRT